MSLNLFYAYGHYMHAFVCVCVYRKKKKLIKTEGQRNSEF